ncbi:15060_t:CDS:1, partial [Racocetra persica]
LSHGGFEDSDNEGYSQESELTESFTSSLTEIFNDFHVNAFKLFVAEGTERMLRLYPGMPLENIRETLVFQWNQMDIYQRTPWIKKADETHEIYSKTLIADGDQGNSEYDSDNSEDINELIESSDDEETSEESTMSFPDFIYSDVDGKQSPIESSQDTLVPSRPVLAPIPSWPRPPAPAFLHFSEYMRPRITAENPYYNYGIITKLIRERWESMTVEERAPWGHLAQQDEIRFENEKLASSDKENIPLECYGNNNHRSPLQPRNLNQINNPYDETIIPQKIYKPDDRRYGLKVPALYMSAYDLFLAEVKTDCMNKYPSLITESHLNKCIYDKWKAMDTEERKPWEERAAIDKQRWENERREYLSDQLRRFSESQRGIMLNDWAKTDTS